MVRVNNVILLELFLSWFNSFWREITFYFLFIIFVIVMSRKNFDGILNIVLFFFDLFIMWN